MTKSYVAMYILYSTNTAKKRVRMKQHICLRERKSLYQMVTEIFHLLKPIHIFEMFILLKHTEMFSFFSFSKQKQHRNKCPVFLRRLLKWTLKSFQGEDDERRPPRNKTKAREKEKLGRRFCSALFSRFLVSTNAVACWNY